MDSQQDPTPFHRSSRPELLPQARAGDGVDVTLIRWMLAMTPEERLQTLQNTIRSILRLRDARPRA